MRYCLHKESLYINIRKFTVKGWDIAVDAREGYE